MRKLTSEEMVQVSGADGYAAGGKGGDTVSVLSDILSNFANGSLNGNSILNDNNILNFVGNSVGVDIL